MNKIDIDYQNLLKDILENGVKKSDRTGTGTISVFGRQIRHDMKTGFPLLTTKKMAYKSMMTELIWFLRGYTNIKYLVENNCHIWDGDAYKAYKKGVHKIQEENGFKGYEHLTKDSFIEKIKTDDEFAKKWGELGRIYGKQWRNWTSYVSNSHVKLNEKSEYHIDQIQNLINELKINPDSRRLMVNAWNVSEIKNMVLPPCHYGFQCYTRELSVLERLSLCKNEIDVDDPNLYSKLDKLNIPSRAISLSWNQRSVDTFLGLPFNISSYALLLEIIAKEVNMIPDELIGNLGDTHLYSNHIDQAKEQISRDSFDLPKLSFSDEFSNIINSDISFSDKIEKITTDMFIINKYQSHPTIKAPLSN